MSMPPHGLMRMIIFGCLVAIGMVCFFITIHLVVAHILLPFFLLHIASVPPSPLSPSRLLSLLFFVPLPHFFCAGQANQLWSFDTTALSWNLVCFI
jgi:hypothetical protein